jgi:hypothetical protein
MKYHKNTFSSFTGDEITNIIRISDDGTVTILGLGEEDEGYRAWVADGNTPTEWNPE